MSPSKVFNMPGLISSSYIIKNNALRNKFVDFLEASEMNAGNIFAYTATVACYENGENWRKQMLEYVYDNVQFVHNYLQSYIPQIKAMIPEASFLMWLDGSKTGMNTDELFRFFIDKAGLGLNKGTIFGPGGENHLRLNVACSRKVLEQAMDQLKKAFNLL
jgi:cystathionine beta-lyase